MTTHTERPVDNDVQMSDVFSHVDIPFDRQLMLVQNMELISSSIYIFPHISRVIADMITPLSMHVSLILHALSICTVVLLTLSGNFVFAGGRDDGQDWVDDSPHYQLISNQKMQYVTKFDRYESEIWCDIKPKFSSNTTIMRSLTLRFEPPIALDVHTNRLGWKAYPKQSLGVCLAWTLDQTNPEYVYICSHLCTSRHDMKQACARSQNCYY